VHAMTNVTGSCGLPSITSTQDLSRALSVSYRSKLQNTHFLPYDSTGFVDVEIRVPTNPKWAQQSAQKRSCVFAGRARRCALTRFEAERPQVVKA
jgi:hypothetical protein